MRPTWAGDLKLIDTSVFIYAQGRPHPYRDSCLALVRKVADVPSDYTIDAELLQEVLHVYSVRGERPVALRTFDRLLTLFPDPIVIQREEMVLARNLLERHQGLSSRDAIHAAVVLTQGLEGIITTDRVFGQIQSLVAYDPRELATG